MLEYEKNDISEGIDLTKSDGSRNVIFVIIGIF